MCPFGDDRDIVTVVVLGGKSVEEFLERHHGHAEGNAGDGYVESLCMCCAREEFYGPNGVGSQADIAGISQ